MDSVLKTYMNLTLEDTNQINIDNFYYLEEYNAYYSVIGDAKVSHYSMDYGWKDAEGRIGLQYIVDKDTNSDENLYLVVLKEVNGNYYFISNESVK